MRTRKGDNLELWSPTGTVDFEGGQPSRRKDLDPGIGKADHVHEVHSSISLCVAHRMWLGSPKVLRPYGEGAQKHRAQLRRNGKSAREYAMEFIGVFAAYR